VTVVVSLTGHCCGLPHYSLDYSRSYLISSFKNEFIILVIKMLSFIFTSSKFIILHISSLSQLPPRAPHVSPISLFYPLPLPRPHPATPSSPFDCVSPPSPSPFPTTASHVARSDILHEQSR
jgi:hypothetical protein